MSNITVPSKNQTLNIYNIGNDCRKNFSRDGGYADWSSNDQKFRELVASLVNNGWLMNESIHIMPVEDDFVYAEEIEKRKQYYMNIALKPFRVPTGEFTEKDDGDIIPVVEGIEISNSELVLAYEAMVAGAKPKHRQLDGYRRLLAIPFANAIRVKLGKEPIKEIPVVKFERTLTIEEQLVLCVQENTLGNLGGQAVSDFDRLCICRNMLKLNGFSGKSTEIRLTKLFGEGGLGRSMKQKLAAIIDCDNMFPQADIFKILDENRENLKFVNKEDVRSMIRPPRDKEKAAAWEPADEVEVMRYFNNPKAYGTSSSNTPAVSGKVMAEASKTSKVVLFKELLEGAANGNIGTTLEKYNDNAVLINAAIEAIMLGDVTHPVFVAVSEYAEEQHAIKLALATAE